MNNVTMPAFLKPEHWATPLQHAQELGLVLKCDNHIVYSWGGRTVRDPWLSFFRLEMSTLRASMQRSCQWLCTHLHPTKDTADTLLTQIKDYLQAYFPAIDHEVPVQMDGKMMPLSSVLRLFTTTVVAAGGHELVCSVEKPDFGVFCKNDVMVRLMLPSCLLIVN